MKIVRFVRLVFASPFMLVGGMLMLVGMGIAGLANANRLNAALEDVHKKFK